MVTIMTTIVSANDINFYLIIPLNAALKRIGVDWNFHDCTIFPVETIARWVVALFALSCDSKVTTLVTFNGFVMLRMPVSNPRTISLRHKNPDRVLFTSHKGLS